MSAEQEDNFLELDEAELDDIFEGLPRTDEYVEEAYANISFRVIYQSHNYFLPQIKDLIEKREVINLRPEYQRRFRWSNKQKSLLIESLFLNIPIPPIFLYESDAARYEVMDGQQRLNAIHSYMMNEFPLIGLEKLSFLNGRSYRKLPPKLRRALDRASISAIVLLQETRSDMADPYLVRRYVFERLNTGGQKLNRQEVRNSIYRGRFNDLIVDLARNPVFCEAFSIPKYIETDENEYYENTERQKNTLYKTMGDCQIVLRFFAIKDDDYIVGSMSRILDKAMERNKDVTEAIIQSYKATFNDLISKAVAIFGEKPFHLEEGGRHRPSVAVFDAIMGALYRRREKGDELVRRAHDIQTAMLELKNTKRDLLTGQSNTAQGIKDRIGAVVVILDSVL